MASADEFDSLTEGMAVLGIGVDSNLVPWMERHDDEVFQWLELINKVASNYFTAAEADTFAKHYHDTSGFPIYSRLWADKYERSFSSIPAMKLRERRLNEAISRVGQNKPLPPVGDPLVPGDLQVDQDSTRNQDLARRRYMHDEKLFLKQCRDLPRNQAMIVEQYLRILDRRQAEDDKVSSGCCGGSSPARRPREVLTGREAPQDQGRASNEKTLFDHWSAQGAQGAQQIAQRQRASQGQRGALDEGTTPRQRSAQSQGSSQGQRAIPDEGSSHSQRSMQSQGSVHSQGSPRAQRSSPERRSSPGPSTAQSRRVAQKQAPGQSPSKQLHQANSQSPRQRLEHTASRSPRQRLEQENSQSPRQNLEQRLDQVASQSRRSKQGQPSGHQADPAGLQRKSGQAERGSD